MILHFRSTSASRDFNHWVAFLGVDGNVSGGRARIIDLPHQLALIPFAELLAKWNGTAIVISQEPIRDEVLMASYAHYLIVTMELRQNNLDTYSLIWYNYSVDSQCFEHLLQGCSGKIGAIKSR